MSLVVGSILVAVLNMAMLSVALWSSWPCSQQSPP